MKDANFSSDHLEYSRKKAAKMQQYILQYKKMCLEDGIIDEEEQANLDSMLETIRRIQQRIKELEADGVNPAPSDVPEGILPKVEALAKGCTLSIWNVGLIQVEGESVLRPFDLNEKPRTAIPVPANSKGTIQLTSHWVYTQEIQLNGTNAQSKRGYQFNYLYTADAQGTIEIQATEHEELIHDWDKLASLFQINPVVTAVNGDSLTLQGGLIENKGVIEEVVDEKIHLIVNKVKERSWTIGLELVPEKSTAPTSTSGKVQELIFENENQAVLSSDQQNVCWEWWDSLKESTKEDIRNRKVKVVITGYTSPPGSKNYNDKLAQDRAMHVAKMLSYKIGVDLDRKCVAILEVISIGEYTDDPRRYVTIRLKRL